MMSINKYWRDESRKAGNYQERESYGATPHVPPTPMFECIPKSEDVPLAIATRRFR
jgi:hypothetical protein